MLSVEKTKSFVEDFYNTKVTDKLCEYITIKNSSPHFDEIYDPALTEKAARLLLEWASSELKGTGAEVRYQEIPGRTPLIFIDVPGTKDGDILFYGHLDKQPPLDGKWSDGLGPYTPVIREERLYGRGSADDGYAIFAIVSAIQALHDQNIPHPHCVIVIEASEESSSPDLSAHLELLKDEIGTPDLVICLDSHCSTYDSLGITDTLRGIVAGTLRVDVLSKEQHSGYSGIIPGAFPTLISRINRLYDFDNQIVRLPELWRESIPQESIDQSQRLEQLLGDSVWTDTPVLEGINPLPGGPAQLVLNSTWYPTMTVIGMEGLKTIGAGGNVEIPNLEFELSFRLPPGIDHQTAGVKIKQVLEYAQFGAPPVTFTITGSASGWQTRPLRDQLLASINLASQNFLGNPAVMAGIGGTIPLMNTLSREFPNSELWVTGLLGPKSSAHGPDEFMHIPMFKGIAASVAWVLSEYVPPSAA